MSGTDPRDELARNPFLVLGLPVGAGRAEVEREAQRLLDALELRMPGAGTYATPFGPRVRGAEEIRAAVAELRDPERRALHEVFAASTETGGVPRSAAPAPWPEAPVALGWRRR